MMHQISEIQFSVQDDSRIKCELENDYNNYYLRNLMLLDLCACSLPLVNNLLFNLDISEWCPEIYHCASFVVDGSVELSENDIHILIVVVWVFTFQNTIGIGDGDTCPQKVQENIFWRQLLRKIPAFGGQIWNIPEFC